MKWYFKKYNFVIFEKNQKIFNFNWGPRRKIAWGNPSYLPAGSKNIQKS